jgi:MerR family Zn(II)-responsive transcriptional regulator of zntA
MLTIGRLAETTGVSRDTIRFYERLGLLAPASRTKTGYRLYSKADVRRLAFIKQAQLCGLSLEAIRELLQPIADGNVKACAAYRTALAEKAPLDRKIEALRAMRDALGTFIAKCDAGSPGPIVAAEDSPSAVEELPDTVPWPEAERRVNGQEYSLRVR